MAPQSYLSAQLALMRDIADNDKQEQIWLTAKMLLHFGNRATG
jgi:hypothetical protein